MAPAATRQSSEALHIIQLVGRESWKRNSGDILPFSDGSHTHDVLNARHDERAYGPYRVWRRHRFGKKIVRLHLARGLRDAGWIPKFVTSKRWDGEFIRLEHDGYTYQRLQVGFISTSLHVEPMLTTLGGSVSRRLRKRARFRVA
jgi:hypothetical protein